MGVWGFGVQRFPAIAAGKDLSLLPMELGLEAQLGRHAAFMIISSGPLGLGVWG